VGSHRGWLIGANPLALCCRLVRLRLQRTEGILVSCPHFTSRAPEETICLSVPRGRFLGGAGDETDQASVPGGRHTQGPVPPVLRQSRKTSKSTRYQSSVLQQVRNASTNKSPDHREPGLKSRRSSRARARSSAWPSPATPGSYQFEPEAWQAFRDAARDDPRGRWCRHSARPAGAHRGHKTRPTGRLALLVLGSRVSSPEPSRHPGSPGGGRVSG
jgi:hypothetical protein